MSKEVTFTSAASPVRVVSDSQRKARGRGLRCLRVAIRTKAVHPSC